MPYKVKDVKYVNRWLDIETQKETGELNPETTIKFVNQIADVPDEYIEYFKKNSEFIVLSGQPNPKPLETLKEIQEAGRQYIAEQKNPVDAETKKEDNNIKTGNSKDGQEL